MLSVNLLATAVVGFYASSINAADYETYPTVAHTASINGFADKIYDRLPECAKPCVQQDTGNTPCPYWDPGCLCVMSGVVQLPNVLLKIVRVIMLLLQQV